VNLGFEDVDAAGTPVGWTCACAATSNLCTTDTTHVRTGRRALVVPPGCMASQTIGNLAVGRGAALELFASGPVVYPYDVRLVSGAESTTMPLVEPFESAPGAAAGFRALAGDGALRIAPDGRLTLIVLNTTAASDSKGAPGEPLYVDDIHVSFAESAPEPRVGTLLRGWHVEQLALGPGAQTASLFVPLPIDWASQVPLDVELAVEPSSVVQRIEYVEQDAGNWGAVVHFEENASVDYLRLTWSGVVLTRDVGDAERPAVFAATDAPHRWTKATPVADASYTPFVSIAQGWQPTTPLGKMLDVIQWTSSNIVYAFPADEKLDATHAYESRQSTCTGYANTASALGRAAGVPTRAVANIMVGLSQDIHSINEFYLGEGLGWRRVEPQSTAAAVPEEYGLIVHLVTPEDEGTKALDPARWMAVGGPYDTWTEVVEGRGRIAPSQTRFDPTFADYPTASNRADRQALLRGEAADMATLFDAARHAWRVDVAALRSSGSIAHARASARHAALAAKNLDDVKRIVRALASP
jgi:transglutaminase-like putative cysteine protease